MEGFHDHLIAHLDHAWNAGSDNHGRALSELRGAHAREHCNPVGDGDVNEPSDECRDVAQFVTDLDHQHCILARTHCTGPSSIIVQR